MKTGGNGYIIGIINMVPNVNQDKPKLICEFL